MGLMEVNGIRVFAYHGCLEEEGRIGGHFRVDVTVHGDLGAAETSDRLEHAVDYTPSAFAQALRGGGDGLRISC
jgi:dihydroneopterin aldolase